ncbi:LemA family protein [Patescibacteria group bacterium]|nr:LemA family protein [Patescibacteria group bacterium]
MLNLKKTPVWAIVLGVVVLIVLWIVSSYNSIINVQAEVQNAWAQVEVQYQRRADLIPQLVGTVEGAADFEKSTLTAVTEARTNWLNTSQDPNASFQDQIASANSFDSALSRLLVTVESYPTLTATDTFKTLQSQLEGTENRVAVARKDFNDVAKVYNVKIRRVPMNFFAKAFGFEEYPFFESTQGSEVAPTVEFDFSE